MSFARIVGKKNWQICASCCAGSVNVPATVQMPAGASVNHCRSRNRSAFPVGHGVWCLGQAEAGIEKSQESSGPAIKPIKGGLAPQGQPVR
jgi:hypothetical protein